MLILASQSPRRQALLARITEDFTVVVADTDETVPQNTPPAAAVEELAWRKALAVLEGRPGDVVIGADTVVVLDGQILGKPRSADHAAEMLRALSGRTHTVFTGVAIADRGGCESFVEHTQVTFIPLSEALIQQYIATGEPMDKAGAYGIQGKGSLFVRSITGDFYTVMGLPVCTLAEKMRGRGLYR